MIGGLFIIRRTQARGSDLPSSRHGEPNQDRREAVRWSPSELLNPSMILNLPGRHGSNCHAARHGSALLERCIAAASHPAAGQTDMTDVVFKVEISFLQP